MKILDFFSKIIGWSLAFYIIAYIPVVILIGIFTGSNNVQDVNKFLQKLSVLTCLTCVAFVIFLLLRALVAYIGRLRKMPGEPWFLFPYNVALPILPFSFIFAFILLIAYIA